MSSPFPGMDPYLEGDLWSGFHHQLAVVVSFQLVPKLQPGYIAVTEKFFLLDTEDDLVIVTGEFYPDVGIATAGKRGRGLAGATLAAPVQIPTEVPRRVPHYRVLIRDAKKRRLVTVIEFLSPTNKKGEGRREYLKKRRRILLSSTHLVEIDLLRGGQRVPCKRPLPPAAYYVFLSRSGQRPLMDVWPIGLRQPLPEVPIPLLEGDADVRLDLQAAVDSVYAQGGYDRMIDYDEAPAVPLSRPDQGWAADRVKAFRRGTR